MLAFENLKLFWNLWKKKSYFVFIPFVSNAILSVFYQKIKTKPNFFSNYNYACAIYRLINIDYKIKEKLHFTHLWFGLF